MSAEGSGVAERPPIPAGPPAASTACPPDTAGIPLNISDRERLASIVGGVCLLAYAVRRPRLAMLTGTVVGASLIARGVTGRSVLYGSARINTRERDTRRVLGGEGGIHVEERVTIARPIDQVYRFWRDFRNLPRFMSHLRDVTLLDDRRSHWIVNGPAGLSVEWDAEVINDVPDQVIGWRSLQQTDIVSAGSVNFDRTANDGETLVTVKLQYEPVLGRPAAWAARLLGDDPARQIRDDLERLKTHLEAEVYGAPS